MLKTVKHYFAISLFVVLVSLLNCRCFYIENYVDKYL